METLNIIKIGGNLVRNPELLDNCIRQITAIPEKVCVVHGGGKLLDELAAKLNIPQQMQEGRRITSAETRDLALMVYSGLISKQLVSAFRSHGKSAIGLSGADGLCIPASRRPAKDTDYGFVGDVIPSEINTALIRSLLAQDQIPVFSSVTMSHQGELYNTNADTIASALAAALSAQYRTRLIYCFEKPGVLLDPADPASVISVISETDFRQLKTEGVISNGMIPKLENAFRALSSGVSEIIITGESAILDATQSQPQHGTRITA